MNVTITAKMEEDRIDNIMGQTKQQMQYGLLTHALVVKDRSMDNSPVKTGAGQASHYVKTSDFNEYDMATMHAKELDPRVQLEPDIPVVGDMEAVVSVAASHMQHVHDGTSTTIGRPFLEEALIETAGMLEPSLAVALSKVR